MHMERIVWSAEPDPDYIYDLGAITWNAGSGYAYFGFGNEAYEASRSKGCKMVIEYTAPVDTNKNTLVVAGTWHNSGVVKNYTRSPSDVNPAILNWIPSELSASYQRWVFMIDVTTAAYAKALGIVVKVYVNK